MPLALYRVMVLRKDWTGSGGLYDIAWERKVLAPGRREAFDAYRPHLIEAMRAHPPRFSRIVVWVGSVLAGVEGGYDKMMPLEIYRNGKITQASLMANGWARRRRSDGAIHPD